MNFFKDAAEHMGAVDHKLIREGLLARGEVIKLVQTAVQSGEKNMPDLETVCKVTVKVVGVANHEPYEASFLAPIHPSEIPALERPGAAVAVRVDEKDPQNIALDPDTDVPPSGWTGVVRTVPVVTAALPPEGTSCTASVLAVLPVEQKNATGEEVTWLVLTVHRAGEPDVPTQIGIHIPAEFAGRVSTGATLPMIYLSTPTAAGESVVPDWESLRK